MINIEKCGKMILDHDLITIEKVTKVPPSMVYLRIGTTFCQIIETGHRRN